MKKQSPILFSTPMVQSVQREVNPKTQTRRIQGLETFNQNPNEWEFKRTVILPDGKLHACFIPTDPESVKGIFTTPFPYGLVGDILWVRESFAIGNNSGYYYFKANNEIKPNGTTNWKPSIHMPKEAARIWLEITDVKVERLQDITEQDAIAEGVFQYKKGAYQFYTKKPLKNITAGTESAKDSFYSLWTSINDTESWLHNPWVWVITFKQVAKPCK